MSDAHTYTLSVTLSEEYAQRLQQMAEEAKADQDVLAGSLLARAIDDADIDGPSVAELLDAIPGAWERIDAARADIAAGRGIPLDEL